MFIGLIKQTGSSVVVELLKRKLFKTSDIVDIGTNSSSNSGAIQVPRRLSNPAELAVHMPIKSGWLLKKRDIIFGWQCRYFVVYVGRVEVSLHIFHFLSLFALLLSFFLTF